MFCNVMVTPIPQHLSHRYRQHYIAMKQGNFMTDYCLKLLHANLVYYDLCFIELVRSFSQCNLQALHVFKLE